MVISKVNETVGSPHVRSFSLRVTALKIEDNHDGTTANWGKINDLDDAVQVTSLFLFRTFGDHQLRFTITYEPYDLMLLGYVAELQPPCRSI